MQKKTNILRGVLISKCSPKLASSLELDASCSQISVLKDGVSHFKSRQISTVLGMGLCTLLFFACGKNTNENGNKSVFRYNQINPIGKAELAIFAVGKK